MELTVLDPKEDEGAKEKQKKKLVIEFYKPIIPDLAALVREQRKD